MTGTNATRKRTKTGPRLNRSGLGRDAVSNPEILAPTQAPAIASIHFTTPGQRRNIFSSVPLQNPVPPHHRAPIPFPPPLATIPPMIYRIDVRTTPPARGGAAAADPLGESIRHQIAEFGKTVGPIRTSRIFLIDAAAELRAI